MEESLKVIKRQSLRNAEYYGMQDIFDKLYKDAKKGRKFTNLVEIISSRNNLLLAFRNSCKHKGAMTPGTDGKTIEDIEKMDTESYVNLMQNKLKNYVPKSVRRVEIPKPNGKMRPLGIPCTIDRIIQQAIKQVLEPICEAQFNPHSYGFRQNRGTEHAIARSYFLLNIGKNEYVVDIDIKGFFDNVDHAKLKKQIWNLGIQDKNLISIINKMLKAEIKGIGFPDKGTPQGGVISPLLANIVLNELDWWISSQWETHPSHKEYSKGKKHRALRNTNLKEMYLVRYADDFKIFCKDHKTAFKIYNAVTTWLKERLKLDISPEKSKVTNLRKNYAEFLGIKFKSMPKGNKNVCQSKMCDKATKNVTAKLTKQIRITQRFRTSENVLRLNQIIMGTHNYYKVATNVNKDFTKIGYFVTRILEQRLSRFAKYGKEHMSTMYKKFYGEYDKGKIRTLEGVSIFPIYGIKTKPPMCFTQDICNYTEKGRNIIHKNLSDNIGYIISKYLPRCKYENIKFIDNSIPLIAQQQGKCHVTKLPLAVGNMECHHKKPRKLGGTDDYKNLVWIKTEVHKLIHAVDKNIINKYLNLLNLNKTMINSLNKLRKQVGNEMI